MITQTSYSRPTLTPRNRSQSHAPRSTTCSTSCFPSITTSATVNVTRAARPNSRKKYASSKSCNSAPNSDVSLTLTVARTVTNLAWAPRTCGGTRAVEVALFYEAEA